jgi:hypothetical protein
MGMGGSFVGLAEGSESLFWNPAGLGRLEGPELGARAAQAAGDACLLFGVLGLPLGDYGGLASAAGLLRRDMGFDRSAFIFGWGRQWADGMSAGFSLREGNRSSPQEEGSFFGWDLGFLWRLEPGFSLGLDYADEADTGGAENSRFSGGLAWTVFDEGPAALRVLASRELASAGDNRIHLGAEAGLFGICFLRTGYFWELRDAQGGAATLGLGLKGAGLSADYALVGLGQAEASQRLSFSLLFPAFFRSSP